MASGLLEASSPLYLSGAPERRARYTQPLGCLFSILAVKNRIKPATTAVVTRFQLIFMALPRYCFDAHCLSKKV